MEIENIITGIIAIGGLITGAIGLIQQRQKDKVSNDATLSGAAMELLQPYIEEVKQLRVELSDMEDRMKEIEDELKKVRAGARQLAQQVISLGEVPVWNPQEDEDRRSTNRYNS